MANLSFLISFKDETHIISVSNTEELVPHIKEKFMISENSVCKLKVYNNDWNEWINVEPHELKGKEKLQLTIQETQPTTIPVSINWLDASSSSSRTSLLSETSFLHDIDNTALQSNSDSTTQDIEEVLLDTPSSSHLKLAVDTLSKPESKDAVPLKRPLPEDSVPLKMCVSSDDSASDKASPKDTPRREEVALKPWPRPFEIPLDLMPFSLLSSLQKGEFPSERLRRQLIQILFDKMAECERYPSKAQYEEVAKGLVDKFPHLAQEIPGGKPYDYWKVKLVDKFRNERKFLVSAEKKEPVKKLKKSPSGHVFCSSDAQLGEDEHSVEKHQSWMKQECQKKKPDQKKVKDLMELTFWHRRKMIISERTMVLNTLELYPALKDSHELQKEFERITGEKALSTSLKTNLSEMSEKIMKMAEKKYKEKVSKLNLGLHLAVAVNESKRKDLEVASAAFLLPVLFRTSSDVIMKYEIGEQRKADGTPCLLWKGESPLTAESFVILAEGEEFGQTTNIWEGIATLTATYWTFDMAYPSKEQNLFNFFEVALFKLKTAKPSRQTSNILMKLKSF